MFLWQFLPWFKLHIYIGQLHIIIWKWSKSVWIRVWPCKLFCILVQKLNCLHTKHMGQAVSFDAVFMYMCEIARDRVFVGEWCQLSMHFLHLLALAASVASKHACPNKQASQWYCSYSLYFLISITFSINS